MVVTLALLGCRCEAQAMFSVQSFRIGGMIDCAKPVFFACMGPTFVVVFGTSGPGFKSI